MSLMETSNILWRQRELLSMLLFKLDAESLILTAGRTRWLGSATYEVELVLEQVQANEVFRAAAFDAVAAEYGLPAAASLADLIAVLDEPWRETFAEHRKALVGLAAEIDAAVRANRELLTSGQRAAQQALALVNGATGMYGPDGNLAAASGGARLIDEAV
ncbi:MAG TPA: flagellar protein FlgN [Actinophytocola sp.]|uniref:flagellar protein FlgN n=1 Tax=Actinophytocola sp. TaxID=1872138 RepID=UPI002DB8E4F9|nr:flagellar protein FlgN [Actinophytocola sp.]HEU5474201.1 flagellar protein FlgN [Actinophytocola sp.]